MYDILGDTFDPVFMDFENCGYTVRGLMDSDPLRGEYSGAGFELDYRYKWKFENEE